MVLLFLHWWFRHLVYYYDFIWEIIGLMSVITCKYIFAFLYMSTISVYGLKRSFALLVRYFKLDLENIVTCRGVSNCFWCFHRHMVTCLIKFDGINVSMDAAFAKAFWHIHRAYRKMLKVQVSKIKTEQPFEHVFAYKKSNA